MSDQNVPRGNCPLQFRFAFGTDVGNKRELNEDNCLAEFPVFVVADGMGGHRGGEVASAIAVETFRPLLGRGDVMPQEVEALLVAAQQRVSAFADTIQGGAGTTLSGVVAVRPTDIDHPGPLQWLVLNIGDSRTYRIRDNRSTQLTVDHSEVQELIDSGVLSKETAAQGQALRFRGRNVITRALGDGVSPVDFWLTSIASGDRILVVSDGALANVSDQDLVQAATRVPFGVESALTVVRGVIEQALEAGGRDNVTAVVVEVTAQGLSDFELPGDSTAPSRRHLSESSIPARKQG